MNILVTGASGFIGKAMLTYMIENGHRVTSVERNFVIADFKVGSYDCIIHLAGRAHVLRETAENSYQAFEEANLNYSLKIAQLAMQLEIKKFIFLSSIGVNGKCTLNRKFSESDIPDPHNDYAETKLEAELSLKKIFQGSNTALTIIRPPLVYGPQPKANFKTLLSLCRYPLPLPFGAIHSRRSLVSVDNLCHFIELCCNHPAACNQTFLISDDHDISIKELISTIRKSMNRLPLLFSVPPSLLKVIFIMIGRSGLNEQLLSDLQIDTSKAKRLLDWQPFISFDEGIKRAVINNVS